MQTLNLKLDFGKKKSYVIGNNSITNTCTHTTFSLAEVSKLHLFCFGKNIKKCLRLIFGVTES